jgi:hypothetical protein
MKLLCALLLAVADVTASKQELRAATKAATNLPAIVCHLAIECVSTSDNWSHIKTNHHIECSPVANGMVSDYSYRIDLPQDFVDHNNDAMMSGKLFANIPGGQIVDGKVIYTDNEQITLAAPPKSFETRHRRLQATTGAKKILVLRISANDSTNTFSASQLYTYIFGSSDPANTPSLVTQYSRLSFGKLNFEPAMGGVIEVPVDMNANGALSITIRDSAIAYVSTTYGVSSLTQLADHVMFCIPPGTGNWDGSSPVVSWRMVLNDQWCGYVSGFMHEMGHNLGLMHSNQNNVEYMDLTSYMSFGHAIPYYPLKSFNGANNAQFGWYSDRQVTVDPSQGGQVIALATFVDYSKSNKSDPVLIQIGTDVFLQYNRAKDFNSQSEQDIDQVTIVQQQNNGTSLLGSVDPFSNPQFTINDLDGSGRNVVITACSSGSGDSDNPDWMALSIGYDQSYCIERAQQVTVAPTKASVQRQTPPPTMKPTLRSRLKPISKLPSNATSKLTPKPTLARRKKPLAV